VSPSLLLILPLALHNSIFCLTRAVCQLGSPSLETLLSHCAYVVPHVCISHGCARILFPPLRPILQPKLRSQCESRTLIKQLQTEAGVQKFSLDCLLCHTRWSTLLPGGRVKMAQDNPHLNFPQMPPMEAVPGASSADNYNSNSVNYAPTFHGRTSSSHAFESRSGGSDFVNNGDNPVSIWPQYSPSDPYMDTVRLFIAFTRCHTNKPQNLTTYSRGAHTQSSMPSLTVVSSP
jgi:hypothetical protein